MGGPVSFWAVCACFSHRVSHSISLDWVCLPSSLGSKCFGGRFTVFNLILTWAQHGIPKHSLILSCFPGCHKTHFYVLSAPLWGRLCDAREFVRLFNLQLSQWWNLAQNRCSNRCGFIECMNEVNIQAHILALAHYFFNMAKHFFPPVFFDMRSSSNWLCNLGQSFLWFSFPICDIMIFLIKVLFVCLTGVWMCFPSSHH